MNVVGIMSGTSLDGIDIWYGKITDDGFSKYFFHTIDYHQDIKMKIEKAISNKASINEVCSLNYELSYEYNRAINEAFTIANMDISKIDIIANHGQTIYHIDQNKDSLINSSLQLFEPAITSYHFKVPVACNFRGGHIAAGLKGAPLIGYFDKYLFKDKKIITLNIGGIANLYFNDQNISFDSGPGNMVINGLTTVLFNLEYDKNGLIAQIGNINNDILKEELKNPYYSLKVPKSTGREDFGEQYVRTILNKYQHIDKYDLIATYTYLTARTIADAIKENINTKDKYELIISGGGYYNLELIKMIENELVDTQVKKGSLLDYGVSPDEKEALAFGYFGYLTLKGETIKLENQKKVVLGTITKSFDKT